MKLSPNERGSLLVEVLLAISLAATFILAITALAGASNRSVASSRFETAAVAYAKESLEQITAVQRTDWRALPDLEGTYRVTRNGPGSFFQIETGPPDEDLGDGFRRTITIAPGLRTGGRLEPNGTASDPNARFVDVTVTWDDRGLRRRTSLATYLTNWRGE